MWKGSARLDACSCTDLIGDADLINYADLLNYADLINYADLVSGPAKPASVFGLLRSLSRARSAKPI